MPAGPVADGTAAGAGAATGGWVAVATGLGGGSADCDAVGELAGPADPDAPGLTRKMPSPARATTIRAKAPLRWPGVGSMALRYFWRRIGRSQNGPGGAGLSPASLLPANGPVPAPAAGADCCPAECAGPAEADPADLTGGAGLGAGAGLAGCGAARLALPLAAGS